MADYEEIKRADSQESPHPFTLRLQRRTEIPPELYYLVSWRSRYTSGSNRRFYLAKGDFWTVPMSDVRELLEHASWKGMLDEQYDDPYSRWGGGKPDIVDSQSLKRIPRQQLLDQVTLDSEKTWGDDARFVVATEPAGIWRKIMMVDPSKGLCTFRSATTDTKYRPVIIKGMQPPWRMDNAMQDASTAIMRAFLKTLSDL